jgi:hypothetical protein
MDVLNKTVKRAPLSDVREHYLPEDLRSQDYHTVNAAVQRRSEYAVEYDDNMALYLSPNSPEFHANALFNKLIDFCRAQQYKDLNNDEVPLINPQLRHSFYGFIERMNI